MFRFHIPQRSRDVRDKSSCSPEATFFSLRLNVCILSFAEASVYCNPKSLPLHAVSTFAALYFLNVHSSSPALHSSCVSTLAMFELRPAGSGTQAEKRFLMQNVNQLILNRCYVNTRAQKLPCLLPQFSQRASASNYSQYVSEFLEFCGTLTGAEEACLALRWCLSEPETEIFSTLNLYKTLASRFTVDEGNKLLENNDVNRCLMLDVTTETHKIVNENI